PLDDDDLLRVPPNPSSLPRASLVCKRWRRLVSDPRFLRRFRDHHRRPPLLGFFERLDPLVSNSEQGPRGSHIVFHPVLEPPDRVPPRRFPLSGPAGRRIELLGCRHGRVAFLETSLMAGSTVLVWDPVTGGHARLPPVPPEFANVVVFNWTVLCAAAGEQGHVHGTCHSSPFKVVAVSTKDRRPTACVYSSETGIWGDIVHHDRPCRAVDFIEPGGTTLIAHAIYCKISTWGLEEEKDDDDMAEPDGLLEFDLDRQSLTVMEGPPVSRANYCQIIRTVHGGVGVAARPFGTLQLQVWHRDVNSHNVATWLLSKTVDMRSVFGLQEHERWPRESRRCDIVGYDEDDGVIFVCVDSTLIMLQRDSMQFTRQRMETYLTTCHPFRSFYFY
ncbi:uncharacterized protein LOC120645856, partial [Panicum virgatum]